MVARSGYPATLVRPEADARRRALVVAVLVWVIGPVASFLVVARVTGATPRDVVGHVAHRISRVGKTPAPPAPPAATRDGRWRQDVAYLA